MAKSLTKMQLQHLFTALTAAVNEKVTEGRKSFPVLSETLLTPNEKIKLIFAGKAELMPICDISNYTRFIDAYTTPLEKEHKQANEKIEALRKQYESEARDIYEKAVFSGASEALVMLKAFQGK